MNKGKTNNLLRVIVNYKLEHFLFWLTYLFLWIILSGKISDIQTYKNSITIIFFHMLVSYFNIYVLIPFFLRQKQYITYFVSLFLSLLLVSFPQAIFIYYLNKTEFQYDFFWDVDFFSVNILSTAYTVALTTAATFGLSYYRREQEKIALVKLNADIELKYLKSQINPHFLFNCLNTIYSLSLKKAENTPETILKLSEMLRYILYDTPNKKVKLGEEVNYIKNYIEIEKLRTGKRAEISFDCHIQHPEIELEPMLLIPFIENGFKHGINKLTNEVVYNIRLIEEEGELYLNTLNTKPSVSFDNEDGGIGISNVKQRLKILYPDKYRIDIKENEQQYEVELKIELI